MEEKLIKQIQTGDKQAFEQFAREYKNALFGYIIKHVGNYETALELYQIVLIKIWKGISAYKGKGRFRSWVFAIAHNVVADHFRKNSKEVELDETLPVESKGDNPDGNIIYTELSEILKTEVLKLPIKQKRVLLLRINGALSFKEIAKIMDEPLSTVLSHMRYGINKLRKRLEEKDVA